MRIFQIGSMYKVKEDYLSTTLSQNTPTFRSNSTIRKEISLLNLRIYGLLICRGDPFTKASVLWNIVGEYGELYWTNPRLKHTFRLLIYFSQILPLKYNQKYSKTIDSPLRDPERNKTLLNKR